MDFSGWVPPEIKIAAAVIAVLMLALIVVSVRLAVSAERPQCVFDRNEPGPQGWWYDVYKCTDGTERRQLVASPRG